MSLCTVCERDEVRDGRCSRHPLEAERAETDDGPSVNGARPLPKKTYGRRRTRPATRRQDRADWLLF